MTTNREDRSDDQPPARGTSSAEPDRGATDPTRPDAIESVLDAARSGSDDDPAAVDGPLAIRRRRLLKLTAAVSVAGFAGAMAAPLKDLATPEPAAGSGAGQRLVYAHHEPDEAAVGGHTHDEDLYVRAADFEAPHALEAVLAYPEHLVGDATAVILLHRLDPARIEPPTDFARTDDGFVAYRGGCPHCGTVLQWSGEADDSGGGRDVCPLHGCEFDPYRGGEVVAGPAEAGLTQLGVVVNAAGVLELTAGPLTGSQ